MALEGGELDGEPLGRHHVVGVEARDDGRPEPGDAGVEPADQIALGALDDDEAAVAGGVLAGDLGARVGAAVEHHHGLEVRGGLSRHGGQRRGEGGRGVVDRDQDRDADRHGAQLKRRAVRPSAPPWPLLVQAQTATPPPPEVARWVAS